MEGRPEAFGVDLSSMRDEVEDALRATTDMLSRATRLLALVSAPSLDAATIRHVEVLALQPTSVMVVAITSTGGVTKRVFRLDEPIDSGLVAWASEYLDERLTGVRLGSSTVRRRLEAPELGAREREFLALVGSVVLEAGSDDRPQVFVGGATGLLEEARADELEATLRLLELLERRAAVLELVSEALEPQRPVVHVGPELGGGQLHELSLVGATYGLGRDRSVPSASWGRCGWTTKRRFAPCAPPRSSFRASSKTYTRTSDEGGDDGPRLLRGSRRLARRPRDGDQASVPRPGARAASGRIGRAGDRRAVP